MYTLNIRLLKQFLNRFHQAESPLDSSDLKIKGLMISSCCLERNSEKMFELWTDLFSGAFKTSARCPTETSLEALVLRLGQLINMSSVDAVNGNAIIAIIILKLEFSSEGIG